MDDLFVGRRVFEQRLAGASGDGFVRRIDKGRFFRLCIDHPEDFLDVVGHLVEFLLAVFKDGLCLPLGPVYLADNAGRQQREENNTH